MRKIVADSSSNLYEYPGLPYDYASLQITVDDRNFTDAAGLDLVEMVDALEHTKKHSSTACPATGDWLAKYEGADEIFAITISAKLSGSYESAKMAEREYLEEHPDRKIWVIDSRMTGPGMRMIMEKINELSDKGCNFEEIREGVIKYLENVKLCFLLASVNNLANAGRLSKIIAKAIGVLDIKMLGRAKEGVIDAFGKFRGQARAIKETFVEMMNNGYNGGKVRIDHVLNLASAEKLKEYIVEKFPDADIVIDTCKGLCSYYAERNGYIVGYEVR
ncbi:MAG: DegV family EDD domain-containing protein [Erysipelotrichaceae bacterium]|nr:DegV family EDD domain-containing protein [Erysipelotrichaceae bacterium]